MSSYYLNLVNDGAGLFTPAAQRGGTASSGGSTLSLPAGEFFAGSSTAATTTKLIGLGIDACFRALINDFVSNPTSSYYINLVSDGNTPEAWTPAVRRGGTAASGGTALSLPKGELFAGSSTAATTTKLTGLAVGCLRRAVLNDRAAGN
jgi:hypothetical protein